MFYTFIKAALFILLTTFIISCATSFPHKIDDLSSVDSIEENMSKVVFIRSHSAIAGGKVPAVLFDITAGEEKIISPILNHTKVVYDLKPGEYWFMVNSDEAVDFMKAELLPGKIYYALVIPFPGAFTYRFSFAPIRKSPKSEFNINHDLFDGWLNSTKLITKTKENDLWYLVNKKEVREKREKFWPRWQTKPEIQRMSQTMLPNDGN